MSTERAATSSTASPATGRHRVHYLALEAIVSPSDSPSRPWPSASSPLPPATRVLTVVVPEIVVSRRSRRPLHRAHRARTYDARGTATLESRSPASRPWCA